MRRNLLLFNLTLLMSILFLFPQASFAAATPSFSLQINNKQVTLGHEIQVTVNGMNLTDVYAFEINLDFDHTMLKYKNMTSSISDGFTVELKPNGNHLQFAFTKTGKNPGENGTVNLAKVTFETIRAGNPAIQLKSLQLVDSQLNAAVFPADAKVTASIVSAIPGGNTGNPTEVIPIIPPINQPGLATLTPDVKLDSVTKIAIAAVNEADWDQTVQQATPNEKGEKTIQIISKEVPGANHYELQLPTRAFANNGNLIRVQVVSPLATVLVSNHMFKAGEISENRVGLRVGKADVRQPEQGVWKQIGDRPVVDISLHAGGKTISWSNPDAPVTVTIPYTPNEEELTHHEHIVVRYLSEEGEAVPVPNGRFDKVTGTVIFSTTHFSQYAVAFVQKTFDDIVSLEWAKKQIEVLASKGVINGVSDSAFDPGQHVSRADFLVLLVRTLDLDVSKGTGVQFSDVQENAYYSDAVKIARGIGITQGKGNNLFMPHEPITREEMMVLTERTLRMVKQMTIDAQEVQLHQFSDYEAVSDYAVNSVAAMVKLGLAQGFDNAFHPKATTNRAQAAVLMYNIYAYLYK
ncbi:S-layer homology domain-containing protein [Candidatus Pristimantibacillus sp. PTI5]|uniref:S-layer homology domain-containing protein n=1 Tax=Candidatus Pristimantibacillus sp. PTI5 TaxID=3400422 RepID=UPI003B02BF5B